MTIPNTLKGFIERPNAVHYCFHAIVPEVLTTRFNELIIAYVAGWGTDGYLFCLTYDYCSERYPVRLYWLKPGSRVWMAGEPELENWHLAWLNSNAYENACGMHRAFMFFLQLQRARNQTSR